MPSTLRVTRRALGIELRRGTFELVLDASPVGELEIEQTVETSIRSGRHTLQIRSGRYSSRPYPFDAEEGEVVNFGCHAVQIWPTYLASLLKPNLGIELRRE
jgi:hypothetical protein